MKKIKLIALLLISMFVSFGANAADFKFTNLEEKYGSNTAFSSINDKGQIAGLTLDQNNRGIITIFDGDNSRQLPTDLFSPYFQPISINNNGQLSANVRVNGDDGFDRGARWNGNNWELLQTLGGINSYANDINDKGIVAGVATTERGNGGNQTRAAIWDIDGNVTNLRSLPGGFTNEASAINNTGFVAGKTYGSSDPGRHPVIWSPGGKLIQLDDVFEFSSPFVTGMNNHNAVIGYVGDRSSFDSNKSYHAILWDGTEGKDIGSLIGLNTFPNAINDNGVVVGSSLMEVTRINSLAHAFIWDEKNGMIDMNSLLPNNLINAGWVLTGAHDINNKGGILVNGFNTATKQETVFLANYTSPIPEPSTWVMLLIGVGLIGFTAKRKRQI